MILVEALKNLFQLTHLNFSGCDQIPQKMLADALKNLPELIHLNLSVCSIEDNELVEALLNLSQLTYFFNFSECDNVTEVQLDQRLKNLPPIKNVKFLCFIPKSQLESVDG